MAKLIAHNPPRAQLKSSGYMGEPTGKIDITENGVYNVKSYAEADVQIPEPTGTVSISENGEYDVTEYATADVNVPLPSGVLEITQNGRQNVFDYAEADVNVQPTLQSKTVTPTALQQTIQPDSGFDGLSDVTVSATFLEEKTITPTTQEQTVYPQSPNIGFSSVTIGAAPQPPTLITKQITENGTYAAEDDNADGYSEVTVDVDINQKLDAYIQGDLTAIATSATEIADNTFYLNTTLQYINMPNVVKIGNNAFRGCSSLLLQELPINLTSIGPYAFSSCSNVSFIDIPNGVTQFLVNTFAQCTSLDTIVLPQNFSLIQNNVFYGCSGLRILDLSNVEGIVTLNRTNAFDNTTCIFLFRDQTQLDAYAAATNWSTLSSRFQIKQ